MIKKFINLLFLPICLLSSCDSVRFSLPFPEYGSYQKETVEIAYGDYYAITNIEFEIVRDESSYKNDSFVTEFINEYDKKTYYAKFAFDINGQAVAINSRYIGPSKSVPGNAYNFGLAFSIGDTPILNYEVELIAVYNSLQRIRNTKDIDFMLGTTEGPATLAFKTTTLDVITVVGEDF